MFNITAPTRLFFSCKTRHVIDIKKGAGLQLLLAELHCHLSYVRHFRCQVVLLWKDVISSPKKAFPDYQFR